DPSVGEPDIAQGCGRNVFCPSQHVAAARAAFRVGANLVGWLYIRSIRARRIAEVVPLERASKREPIGGAQPVITAKTVMVIVIDLSGGVQVVIREAGRVGQWDPLQKPLADGLIEPACRDDVAGERIAREAAGGAGVPACGERIEDASGQLTEISTSH